MKKTALLTLIALSSFSSFAVAGSIQIYGRIDTGVIYDNFGGDTHKSDRVQMASPNTPSRIGIQGTEEIDSDWSVGFRLENRFASDSGDLKGGIKGDKLFEGASYLTVSNKKLGEVSMGRISGLVSSSGIYDLQYYMDSFAGGTYGTGTAPINSGRMDNTFAYRTPMMAGFQGTLMYSMKTETSEVGNEATSDVDRYYAAGLRYNKGGLNLIGAYEEIEWGKKVPAAAKASTSRKVATIGGSYRFEKVTAYLQSQYFNGLHSLDGFSKARDIKGFGIYGGTQFWYGISSWQSMVYYRHYKVNTEDGINGHKANLIGIATKYLYRPSKSIDIYVGGGFSRWDGQNSSTHKFVKDNHFNVFTGITKYF